MISGGRRRRDSFGFPLQGQAIVQLGDLGLVGLHHQRPVGVEEFRDGFGELGFSLLLGLPADESQLQGVLVVKPFETGGELPHVIGVHPGWVFSVSYQENALLFVGGVDGQDSHHHKI